MFINCPNCKALVATDLATDLPPERCPRCGVGLLPGQDAAATEASRTAPASPDTPSAAGSASPARHAAAPFIALTPSRAHMEASPSPTPTAAATTEDPAPPADSEAADPAPAGGATAPDADTGSAPASEHPSAGDGADAPAAASPQHPAEAEPVSDVPAARAASPPARPSPSFLRSARGAGGSGAKAWPWFAAAAALVLLLALQLLLADRQRLAADAGWRPIVASLCGSLRCSLPAWREPAAIVMQQRDVRPAPGQPGVLLVTGSMRNDARWPQAWPRLALTLSDVDGRALGTRVFEPHEYLAGPMDGQVLDSGRSASIRIEIVEPSPHAVAFNFGFL